MAYTDWRTTLQSIEENQYDMKELIQNWMSIINPDISANVTFTFFNGQTFEVPSIQKVLDEYQSTIDAVEVKVDANTTNITSNYNHFDGLWFALNTTVTENTADIIALQNIQSLPVGIILPYVGDSAPSGWLLCDGSSYSTTTYADLYAVLGQSYVPDLEQKFLMGSDSSHPVHRTGGKKFHELTIDELPAHEHDVDYYRIHPTAGELKPRQLDGSSTQIDETIPTSSVGGGKSHENRPPYYSINYIIKATSS